MVLASSRTITSFPAVSRDERGSAIVEYLLLLALIAIVAMIAIGLFGGATSTKFGNLANSIA